MEIRCNNNRLIIMKRNRIYVINVKDLLYIERTGNHSSIQTTTRRITVSLSLKRIFVMLPNNFVRSHKSFIINKNLIIQINPLNTNTVECIFEGDKSALITKNQVEIIIG